ncbi:MAG: methyltransferase domain-containing protein [Oscillospiraceae bacterium]|nr:methyltransferase domain-containing protein [Oscillospiraceae bacterium]
MYICPVCKQPLGFDGRSYRCADRHCFDIARKGYVNLLTTTGHNPRTAGDNADMVRARTEFLDKGYYMPLADRLAETISAHVAAGGIVTDSGCGEGFYTVRCAEKLPDVGFIGIDISKSAVSHCMTRVHIMGLDNCSFAVASSFDLPIADGSADAVTSVFAPVTNDEYRRVLKEDGHLIVVSPSPRHLFELKSAVYDRPYENRPNEYSLDSFELADSEVFEYKKNISSQEDIYSLFAMTPYFYKTSEEGMARLRALDEIDVTCGFCIDVYRKRL